MYGVTLDTGKKAATGFAQILEGVAAKASGDVSLKQAVDLVVGFDGRFPVSRGLLSLTPRQLELYRAFGDARGQRPGPGQTQGVLLGTWPYGRIRFADAGSEPARPDRDWAYFELPAEALQAYRAASPLPDAYEAAAMREISAFYQGMGGAEILAALDEIEYMVDHIDPVLVYCGDETYTLFGKFNNLLDRGTGGPYLIPDLRRKPPGEWTEAERSFIFNMYWLKQSGLRAEEFNGRQLGAGALRELWREKAADFGAVAGKEAHFPPDEPIGAGAKRMRELRDALRARDIIYRNVHGLNFHKREAAMSAGHVAAAAARLRPELIEGLHAAFGLSKGKADSTAGMFAEYVDASLAVPRAPEAKTHPIEDMIVFLVRYCARLVASDIAMSRGFRDLRRIGLLGIDGNSAEASSWPATDYFCCALPSGPFQVQMEGMGAPLFAILNSIAKRMEYNSWHYTPGHFSLGSVPPGRHFYLPPAMPDFAQWSNQHHSGHVISNVMYSIRSPGSLRINGRAYPGVFDLRLMRQTGEPYSARDLSEAIALTGMLGEFYQAVLDRLAAGGPGFRITAFNKEWYAAHF